MRYGCWSVERITVLSWLRRTTVNQPLAVDATLYTRQGCHLCEKALQVLLKHGIDPKLVDIDQDDVLRERFNDSVPVVTIDGRERFRGHVNELLLKRILSRSRV